ncbi:MAG: sugar phosphate nucleotidyltransferase, partial [Oscillospiraceae bacterium]
MKNTTCILFSDDYKSQRNPLASGRTLASVPFGGRYRLIDFTLSSLVNSGIDTIGIITKDKYGSLVDHLSSGKDWDLNRRKGGLQILTPFVKEEYIITRTRSKIDALISAKEFIEYSKCENIIIADTNLVANINYEKMIKAHEDASCDITVLYKKSKDDCEGKISLEINGNQKIVGATFFEKEFSKSFNESLSVYIIKKYVLLKLLDKSYTYCFTDFDRDF